MMCTVVCTADNGLSAGYQPLAHKDKLNFFRLVIASQPPPTREDMEFVVQEIERCGKDL